MAIAFVAASTKEAETDDSIAVPLPGTINANDLIIAFAGSRSATSVTIATPTHSSLTFSAVQAQSGLINSLQRVYWARAAGGETGDVTFTRSGASATTFFCKLYTFSGVTTSGDPWDANAGAKQENTDTGATVTLDAMTLDSADRYIVATYFEGDDDTAPPDPTDTADVTWTSRDNQGTAIGNDARMILWEGIPTDTSPSSTTTTMAAADPWSVQQAALIPAGGGGGATEDPFPYVSGGYYPSEG